MNSNGKILLTGATGFIGTHLAKSLIEKDERVRCLVRKSSPEAALDFLSGLGAELVYGDLTVRGSLSPVVEGISRVFHLGGGGTVNTSKERCYQINADGTRNLLDTCVEQGNIEKFVHVSTCGVMGNIKNPPADEAFPGHPDEVTYSRAKAEAEKIALSYADRLPVTVIRFPGVYGPPLIQGEPTRIGGVTPMQVILSMVKQRRWWYIGNGQTLTHWIHVDDVVRGLELAAEKGKAGEVYILADHQWMTMEKMIEIAARTMNIGSPRRHIPVPVARLVAALFEFRARLFGGTPLLSAEVINAFLVNRAFDISKAQHELGYEPKISLEEGMKETVKWYEANGYL